VITLGGEGSTHVLATAAFARRLGARVTAVRWRHDMNPAARAVAARAQALCTRVRTTSGSSTAFLAALFARRRGTRWVPPGGTSPLGMLGHVNAALELAEQVEAGELPVPAHVVVPLGSGGTAAGLALGFTLAGLDTVVVAARVAPWIVAHHRRVIALARTCAAFIERRIGAPLPRPDGRQVRVVHDVYGGAYGRVLASARASAALLEQASSIRLDDTYSAKAFAAALALARASDGVTLFWLTFDARTISAREGGT
jgi:D-cysteine desulfhydrase